jgi:ABC-type phosphate/phosphonate transport system substrate-binding protein
MATPARSPIALLVFGALALARSSAAEPVVRLTVGFSAQAFADVDREEARSVTRAWTQTVLSREFGAAQAETALFEDSAALEGALLQGRVDLAVVISEEYLRLRKNVALDPVFVTARAEGPYHRIVLIARLDQALRGLADLRGRQLLISQDRSRTFHEAWLETRLLQEGLPPAGGFFSDVRGTRRPSQAILPVFFGQADACLTTLYAFQLTCELNPQLARELTVLDRSPEVLGGVIAFRRGYAGPGRERILARLASLHEDPQGKQILRLFGMDRLLPFEPEYLTSAEALIQEHDRLTARIAKGN